MEYVVSKDGTRIAFVRRGEGPPLVLVHGTGIDHSYWDLVAPKLEQDFTVHSVDRRGRGQSGETAPYAIQREFEDVAAVVESIPEKVFLLGHSYGALCSLEAGLLARNIGKMILNEPPMYTTVEVSFPEGAPEKVLALLRAGESEKALVMIYGAGGMSASELSLLRSQPNWPARVRAAATIPREVLSVRGYSFKPARFKELKTPVLLLVGSETAPVYRVAMEALRTSLPDGRLVVLPGQRHEAAVTAPELYLRDVTGFFLEDPRPV
jgi:pimeloyl-ACP methyl ester carboxylesterase